MTPDSFDLVLTDWLRAEASEQEPLDFHARVVAAAGRTRQRERWMAATAIRLPRFNWTLAIRRPTATLILILATMFMLAVAAAALVGTLPPPTVGGTIVYQRTDTDGDPETAYAIAPDGTAKRQPLLTSQQFYCCPQLSPDGSRIAASILQGDRVSAITVNTDGTGYSLITLPDSTLTLTPSLWLNATEVTFTGRDDGDPSRNGIYVADPEQPATPRQVTSSTGAQDQVLAVSPDGSRIAFVRTAPDAQFGPLFTVDVDGTNLKQINPTEALVDPAGGWGGVSPVSWSPDGSQLTFAATVGDCGCAVYAVDADGTKPRQIFRGLGPTFAARWSPDGQWIAFEAVPEGSTWDQLMLVRPDGSGLRAITAGGSVTGSWGPQWSPDGRWLLFQSGGRGGDHVDLWTSRADGSDPAQLTHDVGHYNFYSWGSWSGAGR